MSDQKQLNWWELDPSYWRQKPGHKAEWDFQKSKCYRAEWSIRKDIPNNRRWLEIEDVQKYVDKLVTKAWFKRRWPKIDKITVKAPKKDMGQRAWAYGNYFNGRITIPMWARQKIVVLHEVAHAIVHPKYGGKHGRFWARTFLELVKFEMGEEAYKVLKVAYRAEGVKFNARKKFSPEFKAAAARRLKEARDAKRD